MFRIIYTLFIALGICLLTPSCNSNKIACPTYADSFPDKKVKKKTEPTIPKATKSTSGLLPKNAKKR